MDEINITDEICKGDLQELIKYLNQLYKRGYQSIYFDGYDASISVFRNNQPERLSEKTLYNNEEEIRLEEIHSSHEEKR